MLHSLPVLITHNAQVTFDEEPIKTVEEISVEVEIPRFIEELTDQEVTEGDTVTLFVKVDGKPFPELTWYRDGVEIQPDDRHTIDIRGNFAALIMNDIQPEDDAEYSITASNKAGKATSKCELFVNPLGDAPSFISSISDLEVELESPIVLQCQVRGTPKKITWLKDGEEVDGDRYKTNYEEEVVTLTIEQSIPEDEGEYTIKAINDKGVATSSAEVLVHIEAPVFTTQLEDVVIELADTAVFRCKVTGIPKPKLQWYIEDTPVVEGPKYSTAFEDNVATLEIKEVSMDESPMFVTCKAENVAGEARSSAELTVEGIYI
ncbi:TITIN-like protein [Mya arenaria]|uniref:TITIN-like protein n=1 Tax=Mya arenaria TaxID=6604 RepID=A0ABY7EQA0_MYAAR|nr:TITIN-like protein [Mya arenaria]